MTCPLCLDLGRVSLGTIAAESGHEGRVLDEHRIVACPECCPGEDDEQPEPPDPDEYEPPEVDEAIESGLRPGCGPVREFLRELDEGRRR